MFSILCFTLNILICFLIMCISLIIMFGLLAHRMICCAILTPLLIIGISLIVTISVIICLYFTILATFAICIPVLGPIIELILSPLICMILCVIICISIMIGIMIIITATIDLTDIIATYCLMVGIFMFFLIFVTLILAAGSAVFVTEVDYIFPLLSMVETILKPLGRIPKDILNILDFKIVRESPKLVEYLLNMLPSIGLPSVGGLCGPFTDIISGGSIGNSKSIQSGCLGLTNFLNK